MLPLRVIVKSSDKNASFTGHRISAHYVKHVPPVKDAIPLTVPSEIMSVLDASGTAILELPDEISRDKEATMTIRVIAPDGEILREERLDDKRLTTAERSGLEINVTPKSYFPTLKTDSKAFRKPTRLRGMVIDPLAKGRIGNRQVVLLVRKSGEKELRPLTVTQTDGRGYFFAPYPLESFAEAAGQVAGGKATAVPLSSDGMFPERVILSLSTEGGAGDGGDNGDAGNEDKTDCDCHSDTPRDPDVEDLINSPSAYTSDIGGRCVDVTKPNRVLEEFDHYAVIRTTEPEIKGLTIQAPPDIELPTLLQLLDAKMAAVIASQKTTASTTADSGGGVKIQEMRMSVAPRTSVLQDDTRDSDAQIAHVLEMQTAELDDLKELLGLSALRLAQTTGTGVQSAAPSVAVSATSLDSRDLSGVRLEAELVRTMVQDPDGFSLTRLASAEIVTRKNDLLRILEWLRKRQGGRGGLTCENPVDWDNEPTFYQACTIAHGHLLHLKQQWVADGYSLGDLLYSLPLAPCQKKEIVVIDWDRREVATRQESLAEQEFLTSQLNRDRDISDIANASVREKMNGGSEADGGSFAGGLGIGAILGPVGGLLGFGGGHSSASSSAWQNSSRSASSNSLQQLRDHTSQAASAVRSQRSTVIQTVRQGETMRVESEVVANHNHCHAITMEYFEVLRHFLVRQHLADVQECLLVPLLMSRFDSAKARRWRESLSRYLRNRSLLRGFDALQRIADSYVGSDMPVGAYADDDLDYMDGYLRLSFHIARPRDNDDGSYLAANWFLLSWLGLDTQEFWNSYLREQQQRDDIFARMLGPRIVREITNGLRVYAVDENDHRTLLPIDLTLVSNFQNDRELYVSLRLDGALLPLQRRHIKFIQIDTTIDTPAGPRNIDDILPNGSRIIVNSGQMSYRTPYLSHNLFNQSRILNDLSGTDGVRIYTPLSRQELRRPREEDKEAANRLIKHLNEHIEHYHRAIWWSMDAQRRYMLLDGFIAPNSGGRSVASVVENRLIGIIGNCLVMPVARGFQLDPTYRQDQNNPIDLLEHYQPTTPIAPLRIAVPTKGVFAEAVMGACNACERKDDSRFWRWEESPCPDQPTPIQSPAANSLRSEPPNLTAKDFPAPIVAFQNVPAAPDPQGFGGLVQMLSNPSLFRDITGLSENQKNALAALQSAFGAAQFFGGKAADLALQGNMNRDADGALNRINEQHKAGAISDEQRSQLVESALRASLGGGTTKPSEPVSTAELKDLTATAGANEAQIKVSRSGGEQVEVDARPPATLEDASASGTKGKTTISLPNNSPDLRAFGPASGDRSGMIELQANVQNTPIGGSFQWSSPDPSALTIVAPTSLKTRVVGSVPGLHEVHFAVRDNGGTVIASLRIPLSVPQFVTIDEDAAAFNKSLQDLGVDSVKEEILKTARTTCIRLLNSSNVRLVWRLAPFQETLPAVLPAANITTVTLRGDPPTPGLLGQTLFVAGNIGAATLNEPIDLFPGGYDDVASSTELDVETQSLILQLKGQNMSDPKILAFAATVYGRLIGETMAHEIVHSLLGTVIPTGHNSPAIAGDLMNQGGDRTFTQRTGLTDNAHVSPIDPANFTDSGIAAIGGLTPTNQALMNARFPLPPAFT